MEQNSSKPAIVPNKMQTGMVPLKKTTICNEIPNKNVNVKTFVVEDEPVLGKVEDNFFVMQDKQKLQQQKQQQLKKESGGSGASLIAGVKITDTGKVAKEE